MTIEIGDIVRFKATGQICEVVDVRANDLTLAVSWQEHGKWYTTNVYSIDVEVIQSCNEKEIQLKQQFEEISNSAIKLAEQIDCSTEEFMQGLSIIMSKLEKRWEVARGW